MRKPRNLYKDHVTNRRCQTPEQGERAQQHRKVSARAEHIIVGVVGPYKVEESIQNHMDELQGQTGAPSLRTGAPSTIDTYDSKYTYTEIRTKSDRSLHVKDNIARKDGGVKRHRV